MSDQIGKDSQSKPKDETMLKETQNVTQLGKDSNNQPVETHMQIEKEIHVPVETHPQSKEGPSIDVESPSKPKNIHPRDESPVHTKEDSHAKIEELSKPKEGRQSQSKKPKIEKDTHIHIHPDTTTPPQNPVPPVTLPPINTTQIPSVQPPPYAQPYPPSVNTQPYPIPGYTNPLPVNTQPYPPPTGVVPLHSHHYNTLSNIRNDHTQLRANLDNLLSIMDNKDKVKLFNDIVKLLSQHDVAEEVVLFSVCKNLGLVPLADSSIDGTRHMEKLLHEMDKKYGKKIDDVTMFHEDVIRLKEEFNNHILLLDKDMLPELETKLSMDDVDSINKWYDRTKTVAPTRPHPSGPHSATGQLLTGPVLSFVDRFRDLSKKFTSKNP
jgi:hypothetical protein